jgi:hypothetical protein
VVGKGGDDDFEALVSDLSHFVRLGRRGRLLVPDGCIFVCQSRLRYLRLPLLDDACPHARYISAYSHNQAFQ